MKWKTSTPGSRLMHARPVLQGAPYKQQLQAGFHLSETVKSMHKSVLVAGGREIIVYMGMLGTIGILVPFQSKDDIEFFHNLEIHLRKECSPIAGREHLFYRSTYQPVKVKSDCCN